MSTGRGRGGVTLSGSPAPRTANPRLRVCGRRHSGPLPRGHGADLSASEKQPRGPSRKFHWRPPVSSTVRPPVSSTVRPPWHCREGRSIPITAPFAGFASCRHIYVATGSVQVVPASSLPESVSEPRALRSRRPRYRLRAGSTALLNPAGGRPPARPGGVCVVADLRPGHHQRRRVRGCARSARVVGIERREFDTDRLVAALLALAADPSGEAPRRRSRGKERRP